ncbi:MAG: chromosomal replication initiator protein DnaA [Gaiellales bacterium]
MTDEFVQGFWSQVEDALRNRISSQDWCSWFSGARAVELGAEHIVIEVPNDFAARFINDRFRPVLEQAIEQAAGVPLDLRLVAAAQQPTQPRPHEDLARAARAHTSASVSAPASVTQTPVQPAAAPATLVQVPAVAAPAATHTDHSDDNVMTAAQLRAELAAGDLLPSMTVEQIGAAEDAQLQPAGSAGLGAVASSLPHRITPGDAEIAGVQQLNDRYRFDTFVIGAGNQMVHAAALSVAESPAQSYNPLFVYGSTGLGKTHLLHAIGNFVRDTRPDAVVAYITTEQFLARFLHTIQQSKLGGANRDLRDRFKAYFRGVDVLLLDDVQFLAGKGAWLQEELFFIFNALHENGRQIVLTSDCKPDRIPKLEDRLRSRFAWGLIADIDRPDRDTRMAILRKKAREDRMIDISDEIFVAIAERITTNVRELEGALTRVVAAASLLNRPVTMESAMEVLESYTAGDGGPLTIDRIQEIVCEHFTIERDELLSGRRSTSLTLPRHIGMYLSRTLLGAPSTEVARRFNRKDHSTIISAERKIDGMIRNDQEVHDIIVRLTERLRAGQSVGIGR